LLLGIDTSELESTIFLGEEDNILVKRLLPPTKASCTLLTALDELLGKSRKKMKEVGAVAISLGPGSFTGLRIGLSLAKSLAFSQEIPLVGIPTLECLATATPLEGIICPLLNGHRGCFYGGFFQKRGEVVIKVSPYFFSSSEEISRRVESFAPQRVRLMFPRYIRKLWPNFEVKPANLDLFSERIDWEETHLRLALRRIREGKLENLTTSTPIYLLPSVQK